MPPLFSAHRALLGAGIIGIPPDISFSDTTVVYSKAGNFQSHSIADDGSLFVAVGSLDSNVLTSTNGTSWVERSVPNSSACSEISTDGSSWVVSQVLSGKSLESSNPTSSWNERSPVPSGLFVQYYTMYDAATGLFFIVGTDFSDGIISTSPDGITWTVRTVGGTHGAFTYIYRSSNNTLVLLGQDGTDSIYSTSTNGTTWSTVTTFKFGTSRVINAALYDAFNDLHFLITVDEVFKVANNSGPPNTSGETEIGTDEGATQGRLIQTGPGGPLFWMANGNLAKWINAPYTSVESQVTDSIVSGIGCHYGFDGNYYICGYDGTSSAYMEKMVV